MLWHYIDVVSQQVRKKSAIIQFIWVMFYYKIRATRRRRQFKLPSCFPLRSGDFSFSFILSRDTSIPWVSPLVFLFVRKGYQMSYNMGYRMRRRRKNCANFEESGCDDKLIMVIVVT